MIVEQVSRRSGVAPLEVASDLHAYIAAGIIALGLERDLENGVLIGSHLLPNGSGLVRLKAMRRDKFADFLAGMKKLGFGIDLTVDGIGRPRLPLAVALVEHGFE